MISPFAGTSPPNRAAAASTVEDDNFSELPFTDCLFSSAPPSALSVPDVFRVPAVFITMFLLPGFLLIGVSGFINGKHEGDFGDEEVEFKILLLLLFWLLGLVLLVSAPDFSLLGERGRRGTHGVPGLLFSCVEPLLLVVLLFTFFVVVGVVGGDPGGVVPGAGGGDVVVDVGEPGDVEVTGGCVSIRSTSFSFALKGFVENASLSLFCVAGFC